MKKNKQMRNLTTVSSVAESETKRIVTAQPMNEGQREALEVINNSKVTFLVGPPGCGKTWCGIAYSLQQLLRCKYKKMIISRPYVLGEKLGYLPGDFEDKLLPVLIPIYDILADYLSQEDIQKLINDKKIQILPVGYLRGCTFKDTIVVVDEISNATPDQLHLLLTRLGPNSKIIVTGDPNQSDLNVDSNALIDAEYRLQRVPGVEFYHFDAKYCVRDPLVQHIDMVYSKKANLKV